MNPSSSHICLMNNLIILNFSHFVCLLSSKRSLACSTPLVQYSSFLFCFQPPQTTDSKCVSLITTVFTVCVIRWHLHLVRSFITSSPSFDYLPLSLLFLLIYNVASVKLCSSKQPLTHVVFSLHCPDTTN